MLSEQKVTNEQKLNHKSDFLLGSGRDFRVSVLSFDLEKLRATFRPCMELYRKIIFVVNMPYVLNCLRTKGCFAILPFSKEVSTKLNF